MRHTIFLFASLGVVSAAACQQSAEPPGGAAKEPAAADGAAQPVAIPSIAPGTRIDPQALPERTHLVFRSKPVLVSGAVDKVGESIRSGLENFTTLVLLRTEPDPAAPGRFRRGPFEIGIGRPGKADGPPGDVVINVATAKEHGVYLGFMERKVLGEREKELSTVMSPGASATMAMYDFRAAHLRDGRRVPIVLRYMALVDTAEGDVETAHWILDEAPDGLRYVGEMVRVLPVNHVMDWPLNVDGNEVSFVGPRAEAFAVTKLPDGTDLPAPEDLRAAASKPAYTPDAAASLEKRVREVLAARPR